nr:MAG TPA: hypothetical protein [Caudoviricetes sp.]
MLDGSERTIIIKLPSSFVIYREEGGITCFIY